MKKDADENSGQALDADDWELYNEAPRVLHGGAC